MNTKEAQYTDIHIYIYMLVHVVTGRVRTVSNQQAAWLPNESFGASIRK